MVFNWFRRQFNEQPETAQSEDSQNSQTEAIPSDNTQLAAESDAAASVSSETQESTQENQGLESNSQETAIDYLSWAKAAYQNIQQQQAEAEVEVAVTETVSDLTEPIETASTPSATLAADGVEAESVVSRTETTISSTSQALDSRALPLSVVDSAAISETVATPESATPIIVDEQNLIDSPDTVSDAIGEAENAIEVDTEAAVSQPKKVDTREPAAELPPAESPPLKQIPALATSVEETEVSAIDGETDALIVAETGTTVEDGSEIELSESPIAETSLTDNSAAGSPVEQLETPEAKAEETPPGAEPVPFWVAAADRQARLERLKATAIEVAEESSPKQQGSEVAESAASLPQTVLPTLDFDEGFLWSAEVLAAQGRRPDDISVEEITWLKKLRQGLDKTRRNLINQLKAIVGQGPLNQDAVLEIEALLLQADVGVEATDRVIEALQARLRKDILPPDEAIAYLKEILRAMLDRPYRHGNGQPVAYQTVFAPVKNKLNIWLMTGVNGAGKTTTLGKIAHLARRSDYRCLIAAADTFRAAAVEQVKIWGQRSGVEAIANPGQNTDPAAVVFDAIAAARSRNTELLLVDTAGRLQNKKNLMDELNKIRRIIDKKAPDATIESLLVLDATLGQNGLRQAEVFAEVAQLSGVVLTKLDGTAKGGVALAVVEQLGLPIRFIGAGEGIEDLRPFSSYEFVEALLNG